MTLEFIEPENPRDHGQPSIADPHMVHVLETGVRFAGTNSTPRSTLEHSMGAPTSKTISNEGCRIGDRLHTQARRERIRIKGPANETPLPGIQPQRIAQARALRYLQPLDVSNQPPNKSVCELLTPSFARRPPEPEHGRGPLMA